VKSRHPVQHTIELVLGRQKGGSEVPRPRSLPETRARHHHYPGCVHQLEAVELVGGYRVGELRFGFGDEFGWQIHLMRKEKDMMKKLTRESTKNAQGIE